MQRTLAVELLKEHLLINGLTNWSVKLFGPAGNLTEIDNEAKTIRLNAYLVDIGSEESVRASFNTLPFDTLEKPVIVEPKKHSGPHKLLEKCPTCSKVAKELSRNEGSFFTIVSLECGHFITKSNTVKSQYADLVFDGDASCTHQWNKTICTLCNAKKLYPFQIAGAEAIERYNGKFAVLDEMGLGKTIQALAYLKYNSDAWPFIWTTKSGIVYQHGAEIMRVLGMDFIPQVLRKGTDKLWPGFKCYLIGYDLFRRLDLDHIKEAGIKTIVLDECQAIMNTQSKRTQAIQTVVKSIPKVIPLSGTPWKNRGKEFFTILNLLDPVLFWNARDFESNWCADYWDGNRYVQGGIRQPEKFREITSHILIRRERSEVLPELPSISRTKLLAEVPEHARKVYKEEEDKIKAIMKDAALEGTEGSFSNQATIMQSLIIMRQIVGIAKVPTTIEFAQEFLEETDRKLVIFVHHKKCGEMIFESLKEWCIKKHLPKPLQLSAELSSSERFEVQDKFNGKYHRLLVASTLASGEGLNLQTCSDCIMHERQWNPANEEQAEGRFIRIGQQANAVNATYVLGADTVDTILDSIVEGKRLAFHSSMNKNEIATWNETSIVKQLAEMIARG